MINIDDLCNIYKLDVACNNFKDIYSAFKVK